MLKKEFIEIFKPFYYISIPFGARKYVLSGNNISKNTKLYTFFSVICNVFFYWILTIIIDNFSEIFKNRIICFIYALTYTIYCASHTMHNFVTICNSDHNVKLLLLLQAIDYKLHSDDCRYFKRFSMKLNIIVIINFFVFTVTKILIDSTWIWSRCLLVFSTVLFDLQAIYCVIIILFIARKGKHYNDLLRNMIEKYNSFDDTDHNINLPNNLNMFSLMEDIIDAIIITEKTCKVPTFTHVVMELVHSLSYIQIWIMWKKLNATGNRIATSHMFGVIAWIGRGLMLEIILCVSCSKLYQSIESIRLSALLLLQKSGSKEDRRLAQNIIRALNIRYRKISACGVFIVDETFPLRFCFVLVNYVIVLLQFAFL